jgi:sugar phosphate isomerase/epimerase
MRIVITPLVDPDTTIDVTEELVAAIAAKLAERAGSNPVLDSLEAEHHLQSILRRGTEWMLDEEGCGT